MLITLDQRMIIMIMMEMQDQLLETLMKAEPEVQIKRILSTHIVLSRIPSG